MPCSADLWLLNGGDIGCWLDQAEVDSVSAATPAPLSVPGRLGCLRFVRERRGDHRRLLGRVRSDREGSRSLPAPLPALPPSLDAESVAPVGQAGQVTWSGHFAAGHSAVLGAGGQSLVIRPPKTPAPSASTEATAAAAMSMLRGGPAPAPADRLGALCACTTVVGAAVAPAGTETPPCSSSFDSSPLSRNPSMTFSACRICMRCAGSLSSSDITKSDTRAETCGVRAARGAGS